MSDATKKQKSLKAEFEAIDWSAYKSIAGNAEAFKSIQDVEKWAGKANRKLADFVAQNRAGMIEQTITKVTEERSKLEPGLEPPYPKKPIEQEAKERVHLEIEAQFAAITQDKLDRINAITSASRSGPQADAQNEVDHLTKFERQQSGANIAQKKPEDHPLVKGVTSIVRRADRLRDNLDYEFRKNRKALIEQAKENGSETPVKDVYRAHAQEVKDLNQAKVMQIHQTFEDHGIRMESPETNTPSQSRSGPDMGG